MTRTKASVEALKHLDPLSSLSDTRLRELAGLCLIESVSHNLDPFRLRSIAGHSVNLVRGELAPAYNQGTSEAIVGRSVEARYPLGQRRVFISVTAVTDVQLVRIGDDLLDSGLWGGDRLPRGQGTVARPVLARAGRLGIPRGWWPSADRFLSYSMKYVLLVAAAGCAARLTRSL